MATNKATTGIINARGGGKARPKPSAKDFKWPERRGVLQDHRRAFAVFVRKKMEETNHTHITLAKTFWGVTSVGGTNGQQVAKWLRMEQMPSRGVAEHVAQFFNASLEQMLADTDPFSDPSHLIVSKAGKQLGAKHAPRAKPAASATAVPVVAVPAVPAKKSHKKKVVTNGHDVHVIDPRWMLPAGVPAPRILMELAPDNPGGLTKIQIDAHVPPEVAMAIYTTLVEHRALPPREVTATVYTPPLVEHKQPEGG